MSPLAQRDERRELRRRTRRRRRGGDDRAPLALQRVARGARSGLTAAREAVVAAVSGDRPMVLALLGVIVLGAVMVSGPAQRYFESESRVEHLATTLDALEDENAALEQRREDLKDPEHIELLAREQQGYVYPGEVPYVLSPPEVERPRIAPAPAPETEAQPWYRRAWEAVSRLTS